VSRRISLFFVAFAALSSLAACGVDEQLDPVSGPAEVPTDDAGAGGSGGEGGQAPTPPPKRTVLERSPFGNVAATENLLWDGDFEWASPFSDQYGWLKGKPLSYAFDGVVVGPACKSGVQCASLAKGKVLAGIAVAAKGRGLAVTFVAKPPAGAACAVVEASLTALFGGDDPDVDVPALSEMPGEDGYCSYGVTSVEWTWKPLLYIANKADGETLVDDAVIVGIDPASKIIDKNRPPRDVAGPLSAARVAELDEARAELAKLRGPWDPPPNAAKSAYERWSSQRGAR
jgi:hypothetical protein